MRRLHEGLTSRRRRLHPSLTSEGSRQPRLLEQLDTNLSVSMEEQQ
jgi:hypothetical protein